jgi:phosphoglycolate phosphatase
MSKYRLAIFDFDGTLADTSTAISLCLVKTFERFNINPPSREQIKGIIGLSLSDAFRVLNAPISGKNELSRWVNFYRDLYGRIEGETSLFSGVKEIFDTAVRFDIKVAVISNKKSDTINSSLKRQGIKHNENLVIGENSHAIRKPDPMLYYSIVQPLVGHISNTETLLIGDTITDLVFAKNSKIDYCWASYGYGKREECIAMRPNFIINQISELSSILF